MELSERFRIKLETIVCHESPGSGDSGPRLYNLSIKDRVSGALLNAYLVGSDQAIQAVVGQDEFLQFARLSGSADEVFTVLLTNQLKARGVMNLVPRLTFVKEVRPLLPPRPI